MSILNLLACDTARTKKEIESEWNAKANPEPTASRAAAGGIEIQLGELALYATEKDTIAALRPLDTTQDGKVSVADFIAGSQVDPQDQLVSAVVDVFYPATEANWQMAQPARDNFRQFVDLYHRCRQLAGFTDRLNQGEITAGWSRYSDLNIGLTPQQWSDFSEEIDGNNFFTSEGLSSLSATLYNVIHLLNNPLATEVRPEQIGYCDQLGGFEYDEQAIPAIFRAAVYEMVKDYTLSMAWLDQHHGTMVFCQGSDTASACPEDSPYEFDNLRSLYIVPGTINKDSFIGCPGTCFTGEAFLKTRDGIISFAELAVIDQDPENPPLPEVASYDEGTGEVIFQRPTRLIDHGVVERPLLHLSLISASTQKVEMSVTPEHRLLVERGGEEIWVRAGKLLETDTILGPDGETYHVDWQLSSTTMDPEQLYNVSFSSAQTGLEPTYLVSPDGENWLIAHNLK